MTPVTFLSLGPGDPELLTIKALKTLKDADVVIVPATRNNEGITKLPMLKDRQAVSLVYDRIFADCVRLFEEGRRVVVAVEGDVSIYASIHYVMERLEKAGIPVEQSAGIPSFIAAAASAGLSLVSQQQRLTILPGDADAEMLHQLLSSNHVVVVMKLSQCQEAVKEFLRRNPQTVCHYFENVGMPEAYHTMQHDEILSRHIPYFSLCIIYPA